MNVSTLIAVTHSSPPWVLLRTDQTQDWMTSRKLRLTLDEADELAAELKRIVLQARLDDPRVRRLANELRDLHAEPSFEHQALALVKRGYHHRNCGS